jgi:hypothetical protein
MLRSQGSRSSLQCKVLDHAQPSRAVLLTVVYFCPTFSEALLFLGFPWAITAPSFMLLLAITLRRKRAELRRDRTPGR